MLTNTFQKFKNVPAVRVRSEPAFLEKLVDHCNADKPFLFGSDSCDVVTKFYHRCIDRVTDPSLKGKFLLVTADTTTRIKDASKEFEGKFVFFSPKITFGVDFSVDTPQDMFLYIKGNSINPAGMYQQATRTRNIENLFYYGESGNGVSRYDSKEEVEQNIEACIATSRSLATTCVYIDLNDEMQVSHNTFFHLFCHNEYVNDVYASNKVKNFEMLLEQNGFDLKVEGTPTKLSKDEKTAQKGLVEDIAEELFEEFLQTGDILKPKFEGLLKNINYLSLNPTNKETLTKFKNIIINKYRVQEHDAVIRLLKSVEHVDVSLAGLQARSMDPKLLSNNNLKAKIINEFDARYGLSLFNLTKLTGEGEAQGEAQMDDGFWKLVKQAFKVSRAKPSNHHEIKQLFVSIVKAATTKDVIQGKQLKTKKDRGKTAYTLNETLIKHHLELSAFKNKSCKGFSQEVVEKFGLTPEVLEVADNFLGDLDA
jgi:hypothetical protein